MCFIFRVRLIYNDINHELRFFLRRISDKGYKIISLSTRDLLRGSGLSTHGISVYLGVFSGSSLGYRRIQISLNLFRSCFRNGLFDQRVVHGLDRIPVFIRDLFYYMRLIIIAPVDQ